VLITALGKFIVMAKKTAKQNGVAKKKAPAEDAANDVETVDLTAGADAAEVEVPSTSKAASSTKKRGRPGKVGGTMKAKASSSSARKGARPVKAPVRYEDPAAKNPKKKRAGGSKEGGEYVVEAIRGIVKEKGEYKFLIKWENYSENSNTWEPPGNVKNCSNQIKKFLDSVAKFGGKD